MPRIPGRLQDADERVVHDKTGCARKIDPEIRDGFRQHLGRRLHEDQHRFCKDDADDGHEDGEEETEGDGRMDGLFGLFPVARADEVRDDVEKSDDEKDEVAGACDGGEGVVADIVADDDGVGGVVELLEQVAEEDRDCEPDDLCTVGALGHEGLTPGTVFCRVLRAALWVLLRSLHK